MLAVVFFDLIPESSRIYNHNIVVLLGLVWGIATMIFVNVIVEYFNKKVVVNSLEFKNNSLNKECQNNLKKSGIFFCLAIAMHNIPEGLAIGATGAVELSLGLTMAIIICLHNIPEGMAITLPLVAGQTKKWKAILLSIFAGSMTIVGAVLGVIVGSGSDVLICMSLAFAGGAMLQVTLCDMIPSAIKIDETNTPFYSIILGILIGFIINCII